jgi:RNA polymerase sigma-70 factor, ECF subfamily
MAGDTQSSNPEHWVDDYGDYLYRYALTRLRDPSRAEDVVQETFLAAWKNRESFRKDASLRTWLTGILKHKIIDQMRKSTKEVPLVAPAEGAESLDDLFDFWGHAKSPARAWDGDPGKDLERKEFWV